MGDRGNIALKYEDGNYIYFYTHWHRRNLTQTLKDALIRGKERWNDATYLARIIFSEMIKDEVMDLTGYGISSYITDGDKTITVDLENQTVDGKSFGDFIYG